MDNFRFVNDWYIVELDNFLVDNYFIVYVGERLRIKVV